MMWLLGAAVLLGGIVPLGFVAVRGDLADALIALEAGTVVGALVLMLLAVGFARSPYADLALVLAVLSLPGGLAFIRFLQRGEGEGDGSPTG
jgi:multisubunit Na+/H+ antiporter MnhF subunit